MAKFFEDLNNVRNIGISAHIDSGKTTTTERILYYTGKIHKIEEVRGGGSGATMDFMELEKEKGITITSAATTAYWKEHKINIIDTPGHVDFTIEVERALRVLDGGIMILCAVGGVQSQSITVDRQMKRYRVPRIAFINKMDRIGANPQRVTQAIRDKLKLNAVPIHLNMGAEDAFLGVVDLVEMHACFFEGPNGEDLIIREIPEEYLEPAKAARAEMLDALSTHNDELMELLLDEQEVPAELIHTTIRKATLSLELVPVMFGSAFKNKCVQNLMDAVITYLPSPLEREPVRGKLIDREGESKEVVLKPDPDAPLAAMAFKLTDEQFGQLTYTCIYQGTIRKGSFVYNSRTGKKVRVGRIVRMHANARADEDSASAGDIIALLGVDCASGDTFCDESTTYALESFFVPDPVVDMSVSLKKQDDADKLSKALNRFMKEDPTFRVRLDPESNETIISGMGELHLDIYAERIRREYKCDVVLGRPKVAYRETITMPAEYDYKHKKQTGGSGQYGHVVGRLEPMSADEEKGDFEFVEQLKGMNIPREFVPAIQAGFQAALEKGPLADYPVIGIRAILEDGSSHDVDSSEMAFKTAARFAFREAYHKAGPVILEPIMTVEAETPMEFQGTVTGDLASRRGQIIGSDMEGDFVVVRAEVPLAEMFGYANEIRSKTQGKCGFSMEFCDYRQVPVNVQKDIIAEAEKLRRERNK